MATKEGFTIEISSRYEGWWRYNVALMCGCFDTAGNRTGFASTEAHVADVGDMCLGRCEAGAVARRVEAAAHQRDVVAPPAFVAARNLDCESLFCCHTVQI